MSEANTGAPHRAPFSGRKQLRLLRPLKRTFDLLGSFLFERLFESGIDPVDALVLLVNFPHQLTDLPMIVETAAAT